MTDLTRWSFSKIDAFMTCPEFFKNRYIERLVPLVKAKPLALGSCMASGVAEFRKSGDRDAAMKAFTATWHEDGEALDVHSVDDPLRSVERGLEILMEYMNTYPNEPKQVVKPEVRFDEELWKGLRFRGRLDGVIKDEIDVGLIEDKTVSRLGPAWFQEKRNSFQVKWYMGVARHLGLFELSKKNLPRALINAIYIHPKIYRFEREPVVLMNKALDEAMIELKEWIDHIVASVKLGIFPKADYSVCMKWGGCDYLPLRGASGKIRERIIAAKYQVAEEDEKHG